MPVQRDVYYDLNVVGNKTSRWRQDVCHVYYLILRIIIITRDTLPSKTQQFSFPSTCYLPHLLHHQQYVPKH